MSSSSKKGVLVLFDGLGDEPNPLLGGLTPLAYAHTPHLDRLASQGLTGLVNPVPDHVAVHTHTGTGMLFGIPAAEIHLLQRGPIEASGLGLSVDPGDVILRCNWSTVPDSVAGEDRVIPLIDRRAGRIQQGTAELAAALDGMLLPHGVQAYLRPALHHRAVLQLAGEQLSQEISDSDPGDGQREQGILPVYPLDEHNRAACRTAEALNYFLAESRRILAPHQINQQRRSAAQPPANALICRGAGIHRTFSSLVGEALGMDRVAVVTGDNTVSGLAGLFGFHLFKDDRFTALADTDIAAKVEQTLQALQQHDLVFLHLKATDILAHDLDPIGKAAFIERADRELAPLLSRSDLVIGVSSDHCTSSIHGGHCRGPVPSILWSPASPNTTHNESFSESECAQNRLAAPLSTDLMVAMLRVMGYP